MFVAPDMWIDLASDQTYQAMRSFGCKLNSCIEAACIADGLAQRYGYLCEPIPVAIRVIGKRASVMLPGPDSRKGRGFAGHLIVYYPGADRVVDLTSDQFSLPEWDLLVPAPLGMPVTRDSLVNGVVVTVSSGLRIVYRELVNDVSWRSLPAWTESSDEVIEVAKTRLDAALTKSR